MTRRKNTDADFSAAREKLKGIGDGLSGLFDAVSTLIDEASTNKDPGSLLKTDFNVRVRTLDDIAPSRPVQPRNTQSIPLSVEEHEIDRILMVIIDLGRADATALKVVGEVGHITLEHGAWRYSVKAAAGFNPAPINRSERNGYLTLQFSKAQTF
ncbi:MAG: hypothetical protein AAGJ09_08500 [Pseudomonadota bacterium]